MTALLADTHRADRACGAHDLIIAATARATNRTVVTADPKGFEGLSGVSIATYGSRTASDSGDAAPLSVQRSDAGVTQRCTAATPRTTPSQRPAARSRRRRRAPAHRTVRRSTAR